MTEMPQGRLVIEADPKKPWKAVAAAVASGLVAFVLYWVADEDPFTWKDAGEALVAGVAASGLVGGTTFGVRNPLRSRELPPL